MSIVALSPVAPEPPSPMITSVTPVTPTVEPDASNPSGPLCMDQSQDEGVSPPGSSRGSLAGVISHREPSMRPKKPPPLHTGADWKVVLHLPEIEKWLRATSDRVTQLAHSVSQDSQSRHVDVHLVQLKDICEDISDHVEQIHALLETEFSLKLLSYSVNIIVDIRTVQLLWHQLRVSVLVLKERLLQSLQDSNGNFTRQTDILQAFTEDQHETRLDALTEVDDCGKLTIRCSQDYFSLDCGITAFELSDYSPSEEQHNQDATREADQTPRSNQEAGSEESPPSCLSNQDLQDGRPEQTSPSDPANLSPHPGQNESAKRPLQGVSRSSAEASPTQPSLPKKAALFWDRGSSEEVRKVNPVSGLQHQAELSRSTPSLMDPPDRTKFWLELDSVYPEHVSQSCESLQNVSGKNLFRNQGNLRRVGTSRGAAAPERRSFSVTAATCSPPPPLQEAASHSGVAGRAEHMQMETNAQSEGDSDSSLPSPMREQYLSSDVEASGEESDPRPPLGKAAVWIVKRQGHKPQPGCQVPSQAGLEGQHWYGSEEFLALPAQLRKTEMLALKLESLAHSIPLQRPGSCSSAQEALQDVDDWDLTELNPDWDIGEGDACSPPPQLAYKRNLASRFSSASSSDVAPSLDESIDSGPLSDLQSDEDEGRRSADRRLHPAAAPPVDSGGGSTLVHQLLEDMKSQDGDPDTWKKTECFVQQLDGFIWWLQEALDSTENWTQPRQELDSLRVYLDTHLSFKLNVDSHSTLKESILEEGKALLPVITSHQSGLKDILHMVSSQWDQLQRQIRRQHSWMLRALRCIQARLLYSSQSQQPFRAPGSASTNRPPPCPADGLKAELVSSQFESQRAALEQMSVKLSSLQYPSPTSRRRCLQLVRNNSLQEFESEYQELWDWLMDMDAMVTDSHQLMMSEEQRHHLFKSSHAELMMMESRKVGLLGRAECLKRSATQLPAHFHRKIHNLTHTWQQLEKILSEHSGPGSSRHNQSGRTRSLVCGGHAASASAVDNPRAALSPLTNSLLEQLEARIKELKTWLRDTELLIFNSCLKEHRDASQQLQSFKSLCSEVRARRRGVASVLKLCQKLLQQSQSGPMAEVGPEAEQHWEALQLLSINLERRWEAIVMQALQWQNRLKKELGEQQVPGNFLEPGLADLHQMSPVPQGPVAPLADDSWEWDETDMTITEPEPKADLMHSLPAELHLPLDNFPSDGSHCDMGQTADANGHFSEMISNRSSEVTSGVHTSDPSQKLVPNNNNVYQVFSLHSVELYRQPEYCHTGFSSGRSAKQKQHILLKSMSKDSSFSSMESLPDFLGGLMSDNRGDNRGIENQNRKSADSKNCVQSASSRRSESESGIVSDTGDTDTNTTNSGIQGEEEDLEAEQQGDVQRMGNDRISGYHQRRVKAKDVTKEKGRRRDMSRRSREDDKRRKHRKSGGETVEILINGHGIVTATDSDSDLDMKVMYVDMDTDKEEQITGLERHHGLCRQVPSPVISQASSLESILALGVELFPSKDLLHRSSSLESCLVQCRSTDGDTGGSMASLGDQELCGTLEEGETRKQKKNTSFPHGEPSSGELSRRTLDLLKRLENIQTPLAAKMTRSVSDMTLRSSSPQRSRLPPSTSLGGSQLLSIAGFSRKGPPSLINESSATASLTELSSTEDSSLASEDFAMLSNQRHLFQDPSAADNTNSSCHRRQCNGNGQRGADEADGASLSLLVNVSCTDEDEDDSDLLSSSTLTLTEEELGVREGEDEEQAGLSGTSSGNEGDEDVDGEDMGGPYIPGLDYMKRELQTWIRSPRTSSSSLKTEAALLDELQCGTNLLSSFTSSSQNKEQCSFLCRTPARSAESSNNSGSTKTQRDEENWRNATRSYISQFVDDVENGNVDQSCLKGKDEDDELLREESSVFTKKGEPLREYLFTKAGESFPGIGCSTNRDSNATANDLTSSPSCELLSFPTNRASSLAEQLKGELPCHSPSLPSPGLSPVNHCRSHGGEPTAATGGGRKAITIQEKFKFSSFVTEEAKREVIDRESSMPPKRRHSHSSCCGHLPSPAPLHPRSVDEGKKENVHNFVMEIIDMTSTALKNKENRPDESNQNRRSVADQSPAPAAQIRDKVLQHSHRPLHLRKGDFYSYLSLSSHDSDCGEVSQCSEEKSATPLPYSIPAYGPPAPPSLSPELFTSTRLKIPTSSRLLEPQRPSPSPPTSPDIRDEETLFSACTEEVYLGPPLCYSVAPARRPRCLSLKEEVEYFSSLDPGYELNTVTFPPADPRQEDPPQAESALDGNQVYFQRSGPTEEEEEEFHTSSTSSPLLAEPCHGSISTWGPSDGALSDSPSPPSPPPPLPVPPVRTSSGDEEERRGEEPRLLRDVAAGGGGRAGRQKKERSGNEGPPYLNPRARVAPTDSSAARRRPDTAPLRSNTAAAAVMTEISVGGAATNPSKEAAAAAAATTTRINPKINCSAMSQADRLAGEEEQRRGGGGAAGRRGRSGPQRGAMTAATSKTQVRAQSTVSQAKTKAAGRSQESTRPATSRAATVRKLSALGAGPSSRIQL